MKKVALAALIILSAVVLYAASGTPSTLRVNTDTSGNLLVTGGTLTGTTTSSVFSNTRLNTDSSGNLLVVLAASTSPFVGPTATDCSVVTYTFTGRLTTGLNSHAANTWNLCGGGTLGLSGNATDVISSLQLTVPKLLFSTNLGGINPASDGIFTLLNNAGTDFSRLQFGGTTSSFPALKRSGQGLIARLADDSGNANFTAQNYILGANGGIAVVANTFIATAPTIASGGCTSPAVTWSNGTATFLLTIGSSCTGVKTVTLTMPVASHEWVCQAQDQTTPASFIVTSNGTSTTAVVLSNYSHTTGLAIDFVAAEVLAVSCSGG